MFRSLIKARNDLFYALKNNPGDQWLRKKYVIARNKVTNMRRSLTYEFNKNQVIKGIGRGKSQWNVINEVMGRNKNQSCQMISSDGRLATEPDDIAASFSKYFSSCVKGDLTVADRYTLPD